MADSTMTIIAMVIAVIIMVGLPLISFANSTDEITNLQVQTLTNEFVNDIRTKGVLDLESYNNYLTSLATTGSTYTTEIFLQIANDNLEKKELAGLASGGDRIEIGTNIYITKYSTQVLDDLQSNGSIRLNEGDIITVTTQNNNITIAQQLRNFFYRVTGNTTEAITGEATGMITTTGN